MMTQMFQSDSGLEFLDRVTSKLGCVPILTEAACCCCRNAFHMIIKHY